MTDSNLTEIFLSWLGFLIPGGLLLFAVRRWCFEVPASSAAILFALTAAFLAPALLTSSLPYPVDEVVSGWPYRGIAGEVTAKNPLTNDVVRGVLPWMQASREQIFAGRAPL